MSEGAIKIFLEGFDRKDHLIQRLGKGLNSLLLQASPWPFTIWQEMQQILSVSLCMLWRRWPKHPHMVCSSRICPSFSQDNYLQDFLSNPKLPHIKGDYVWDPDMVLDMFWTWPWNKSLSLFDLSRKTATLIKLCAVRCQTDVVNLNLACAERGVRLYTSILRRPSKTFKVISMISTSGQTVHTGPKICSYIALCHNIEHTSWIHRTQFLMIMTNTHAPVAPATLSRWMKKSVSWSWYGHQHIQATHNKVSNCFKICIQFKKSGPNIETGLLERN